MTEWFQEVFPNIPVPLEILLACGQPRIGGLGVTALQEVDQRVLESRNVALGRRQQVFKFPGRVPQAQELDEEPNRFAASWSNSA